MILENLKNQTIFYPFRFLSILITLILCFGSAWAASDVSLEGREMTFKVDDEAVFVRSFPETLGRLSGPARFNNVVYLGVGPVVYAFDQQGAVLGRADMPAPVTSLDASTGAIRVSTLGKIIPFALEEAQKKQKSTSEAENVRIFEERFTLAEPQDGELKVIERVVIPPIYAVTGWLSEVSNAVDNQQPEEVIRQIASAYPDNPFFALRVAKMAKLREDGKAVSEALGQVLQARVPFPAWTQLAIQLEDAGFVQAANTALFNARKDAARRGFDPEIAISQDALKRYGDPISHVEGILEESNVDRAEVWMRHLRTLHPHFEGGQALFLRYADLLDSNNREGEAEEWRQFVKSLRFGSLYNLGAQDTSVLRDTAYLFTWTLVLALLAAFFTLNARALRLHLEDIKLRGGWLKSWRTPLQRLRITTLSYASFSERLVLVFLSIGVIISLAGWQWAHQIERGMQSPALNFGTYGGGWYDVQVEDLELRKAPQTQVLKGLTVQLQGDNTEARRLYAAAGNAECALNNWGVIAREREDNPTARSKFRAALALNPAQSAAQYNLGLQSYSPATEFQKKYRPKEARLCYPSRRDLVEAVGGSVLNTLRKPQDPLAMLIGRQSWNKLDWAMVVAILLTLVLLIILLLPRSPRVAELGRPNAYRLLGVAIPGSTLISNAWGGVLLVLWAMSVIGLFALFGLVKLPALIHIEQFSVRNFILITLILTYLVNSSIFLLVESRWAGKQETEEALSM